MMLSDLEHTTSTRSAKLDHRPYFLDHNAGGRPQNGRCEERDEIWPDPTDPESHLSSMIFEPTAKLSVSLAEEPEPHRVSVTANLPLLVHKDPKQFAHQTASFLIQQSIQVVPGTEVLLETHLISDLQQLSKLLGDDVRTTAVVVGYVRRFMWLTGIEAAEHDPQRLSPSIIELNDACGDERDIEARYDREEVIGDELRFEERGECMKHAGPDLGRCGGPLNLQLEKRFLGHSSTATHLRELASAFSQLVTVLRP